MHELGLCDALMRMVKDIAAEQKLSHVEKITLSIGELSGVVPAYMTDCWDAVIDGTDYRDVKLAIETVPGIAQCMECGEEFHIDLNTMHCPFCGGGKLAPVSGQDMELKEIEAW